MPYTTPVAGTTITAAYAIANIRDQVVTPFATAAARTSAITTPVQGMLSYRSDLGSGGGIEQYNGSAWVPAGAQLISAQTLGVAAGTVTFSGIPSVFGSLMLAGLGSVTGAGGNIDCPLAINGDTSAQYTSLSIDTSQSGLTPASAYANGQTSAAWALSLPGTTSYNAQRVSSWSMTIPGYANTVMRKAGTSVSWTTDGGTSWAYKQRNWFWNSTTAITTLAFTSGAGLFSVGSYFALYGMP